MRELVPTYIKPEDANIKEIATTREKQNIFLICNQGEQKETNIY